jgi:4a-hydroxytetrahydrobiopterin dehydratase
MPVDVSHDEFAAAGLDDWRWVLGALYATFRAPSFAAAADLAVAVTAAADAAVHHPDIDIRYPGVVRFALMTHETSSVTALDLDLARTISTLATTHGSTSLPLADQQVEIGIDTLDANRIRPFWQAVLGYVDRGGVLVDPRRFGPRVWFQTMDGDRPGRGRIHLDVSVAHDEAPQRIEAALAAGGTLVTDRFARAWWVLADADGNEVCVCTWQDRD